jgi:hypothetical protein
VAASFTFLPWARRGLASGIAAGTGTAALPARATISVGLTLSGLAESRYDLTLYGPGDVLGIDPKLIIRTDPRAESTGVEPNYLPLIEFDPPDFPWMFTPAPSGSDDRLRPWCVLVVVDLSVVAAPRLEGGRPLPVLVVPSAAAGVELPDLAESWAWAHTQLITPQGGDITTELADRPAMNVSRLLAPRRLEPGKRYAACLVPAFDIGVVRGLGGAPAKGATLGPAWPMPATPPGSDVRLPVYFHWEFTTGPVGDFEELARGLQPNEVPSSAGGERMYLSPAELQLPATPPTYLSMDGALRPRESAPGTLAEVPDTVQKGLRAALDAAALQASSGPTPTTPGLGPPIYGAWYARQHTVPADVPVWLRELNLDPRARAAAGLGAEIVRQNQEQFMQWCWEQVEHILEATRQLSQARLSLEALARVHARHFATLPKDRLLQITAPLHSRTTVMDVRRTEVTVAAMIAASSMPTAVADPALRRLTSPQRPVLRAALARATPSPAGTITARMHLMGRPEVDPTGFVPHGLLGIPAMASVPVSETGDETVDLSAIGLPLSVPAGMARWLQHDVWSAGAVNPTPQLVDRDDRSSKGMLGAQHLRLIRDALKNASWWEAVFICDVFVLSDRPGEGRISWEKPPMSTPPITDSDTIRRLTEALSKVIAGGLVVSDPPPVSNPMAMDLARGSLLTRTDPRGTVPSRLATMLTVGGRNLVTDAPTGVTVAPTLDRVMVFPEIDVPVYGYLATLDPARFLPGVGNIPDNSITVLATNPRFVEALMVGLNAEMNRELLWRSFPTDQRGTPFRRFWDRGGDATDIEPIHTWPAAQRLGANGPSGTGGQIALLVRGPLLRRYPNTAIYAWRARHGVLIESPQAPRDIKSPVLAGVLGPDTVFVGFDLTAEQLRQGDGWFFVLQEQPTEPRFGFDEFPGPGAPPALKPSSSWSDVTWQHTATAPGHYLRINGNPLTRVTLGKVTFVTHAAHLAAITMQKPMRVAFHAGGLPQLGSS